MLVRLEIEIRLQGLSLFQIVEQAERQAGLIEQAQRVGGVIRAALSRQGGKSGGKWIEVAAVVIGVSCCSRLYALGRLIDIIQRGAALADKR